MANPPRYAFVEVKCNPDGWEHVWGRHTIPIIGIQAQGGGEPSDTAVLNGVGIKGHALANAGFTIRATHLDELALRWLAERHGLSPQVLQEAIDDTVARCAATPILPLGSS